MEKPAPVGPADVNIGIPAVAPVVANIDTVHIVKDI
jgi:hypothetical protein